MGNKKDSKDKNKVYVIDFGLASKYLTPSGDHIPFSSKAKIRGTPTYMSLNCHKGF